MNMEAKTQLKTLPKTLSGIQGLDEITQGGLPKGRPTLVCGNAGCGKTLLGLEFLYEEDKYAFHSK
jgi:circadian clock protein KaiC